MLHSLRSFVHKIMHTKNICISCMILRREKITLFFIVKQAARVRSLVVVKLFTRKYKSFFSINFLLTRFLWAVYFFALEMLVFQRSSFVWITHYIGSSVLRRHHQQQRFSMKRNRRLPMNLQREIEENNPSE